MDSAGDRVIIRGADLRVGDVVFRTGDFVTIDYDLFPGGGTVTEIAAEADDRDPGRRRATFGGMGLPVYSDEQVQIAARTAAAAS